MPKRKTTKTPAPSTATPTPGLAARSQRRLGPVVAEPFKDIPIRPATHDAMFRVLAKALPEALLVHVPEEYLQQMDLDQPPTVVDGSQHDESLRLSQCDALLEVALKRRIKTPDGEEPDFSLVLFEHKSQVEPGIVLQLEGYRLGALRDYAGKRRGRRGWPGKRGGLQPLPLFIALVFYHGSQEWTAPTSLREMFRHQDLAGLEMEGLRYVLIDLGRIPIEALAEDPRARAVLTAMRFATRGREGEPYFAGIVKALAGDETLQRQVKFYIMSRWDSPMKTLIALEKAVSRETGGERIMQSCGDMLIAEGRAEGLAQGVAQGMAQGVAQGEVKGMANMVIAQMRHRFNGRLSERDEARVAQGSAEELGLWGERLLTADSPETVFDPGSQRRH